MVVMQSNPGGYNGSSFLLVYHATQILIANGQSALVSHISEVGKSSASTDEIMKRIKEHLVF
jgi:hypothetical protein